MADIVCFSGNGMSRQVADGLRSLGLGSDDGSLGFVFPVYGWRPPKIVARFIREGLVSRLAGRSPGYVWAVMTCGFDVGYADKVFDQLLCPVLGRGLDAAFSVQMPDTYIGLPGFRLNPPEVMDGKMRRMAERLPGIARRIQMREHVRDLGRGVFPRLKTHVFGRIFDRFFVDDRFFHATAEKCTKCGKCVSNCPAGSIGRTGDGGPVWRRDGSCTGCLRCLHGCPAGAIEFGWFTKGKRRLGSDEKGRCE